MFDHLNHGPWSCCYFQILILAIRFSTITLHSLLLHYRVSCFVIILIWVRLFRFASGFRPLGPLVAILTQTIGDIIRYFTLYTILFVPYVICFWVLFGGVQSENLSDTEREDLTQFQRVGIMIFRMGLIDDYPYSVRL